MSALEPKCIYFDEIYGSVAGFVKALVVAQEELNSSEPEVNQRYHDKISHLHRCNLCQNAILHCLDEICGDIKKTKKYFKALHSLSISGLEDYLNRRIENLFSNSIIVIQTSLPDNPVSYKIVSVETLTADVIYEDIARTSICFLLSPDYQSTSIEIYERFDNAIEAFKARYSGEKPFAHIFEIVEFITKTHVTVNYRFKIACQNKVEFKLALNRQERKLSEAIQVLLCKLKDKIDVVCSENFETLVKTIFICFNAKVINRENFTSVFPVSHLNFSSVAQRHLFLTINYCASNTNTLVARLSRTMAEVNLHWTIS